MQEARLTGMTFMNRRTMLGERFGNEKLKAVLARLPKPTADILRMPMASEWYPISRLAEIDTAICEVCLGGDLRRLNELGRFNLEQQVTGLYRFLFRFLEPAWAIRRSAELWRKLVDQGQISVVEEGKGRLLVRVSGFHPGSHAFCHALRGSYEGVMAACGAKNVLVEHTDCVLDGKPDVVYRVSWS